MRGKYPYLRVIRAESYPGAKVTSGLVTEPRDVTPRPALSPRSMLPFGCQRSRPVGSIAPVARLPSRQRVLRWQLPMASLAGDVTKFGRGDSASPAPATTLAQPQQNQTQTHHTTQQPFLNPTLPPGYSYTGLPYYAGVPGVPSAFQYGPTMFVSGGRKTVRCRLSLVCLSNFVISVLASKAAPLLPGWTCKRRLLLEDRRRF